MALSYFLLVHLVGHFHVILILCCFFLSECGISWWYRLVVCFKNKTIWLVCLFTRFLTSQSTIFELCWGGSSCVGPLLSNYKYDLLKDTLLWRLWGSNPRSLGLESSTLPLSHCTPYLPYNWHTKDVIWNFHILTFRGINLWASARDFQQFDILTSVDSDGPVQPPFKLRNSKWRSVSSLTTLKYSSD